ncbi:MAG: hypothetical protein AB1899_11265 [Pseudomonadota bacterium]
MAWFKTAPRSKGVAVLTPVRDGLAALRLERHGEQHRLAAFFLNPGQPADADHLGALAREAGLASQPLVALLDPKDYQTVTVDAPAVPDEELRSAIRWKVKEMLNFHVDDSVLDHLPIPAGGGRGASLYVVAGQSPAVRQLARAYQEADLPLEVIDVRETAQHNLARRLAPPDYAVALLHLGGDLGLLTFSFGDHLILSRRIEGRGAAGEFLHDKVALEAQRSVDYFERQYSWLPLAKLYLAPMAESAGLVRRLKENLAVGVETVDLDRFCDLGGVAGLEHLEARNAAFHLLGAALREG